ncbi:MAG: dipeptidase [Actinomycetaceae bacterium]|nr:dipeptidase [Actinomycetaceae bacterium]
MISFDTLTTRVDEQLPRARARLEELVRIPTISSLPAHRDDLRRSAGLIVSYLDELGFEARQIELGTPSGLTSRPAIVARRPAKPGNPTVLLYAHHDVQPVIKEEWDTDPFEPVQKGERLYGRGTADDKVGVSMHLAVLDTLKDDCGVGITLFIEGEEEVGSPTFRDFLETYRDELAADIIIVADSSNWKSGIPSLTVSLRGVTGVKVCLDVLEHGVHSGEFGGPIIDAATAMCRLIATCHDERGNVAVVGLDSYEASGPEYAEDDFRADSSLLEGCELVGEGSLVSRLWTKPALDLIGMDVTSCENASNTLIPSCTARLSLRVAPGQDPAEAAEALRKHLLDNVPFGARIDVEIEEAGPSFRGDTSFPAAQLMREALEEAYGHEVVDIGVGGSIPFIADFQNLFPDAEVLVTGVSDPDARLHANNESLYLPDWRAGILSEALFISRLETA